MKEWGRGGSDGGRTRNEEWSRREKWRGSSRLLRAANEIREMRGTRCSMEGENLGREPSLMKERTTEESNILARSTPLHLLSPWLLIVLPLSESGCAKSRNAEMEEESARARILYYITEFPVEILA